MATPPAREKCEWIGDDDWAGSSGGPFSDLFLAPVEDRRSLAMNRERALDCFAVVFRRLASPVERARDGKTAMAAL
jgi:hypothetical protein